MISSFFFFKQRTAYEMRISDWSSDVCSSDLPSFVSKRTGGSGNEEYQFRRHWAGPELNLVWQDSGGTVNSVLSNDTFDFVNGQFYWVAVIKDGADEIGRASCRERVCQYV